MNIVLINKLRGLEDRKGAVLVNQRLPDGLLIVYRNKQALKKKKHLASVTSKLQPIKSMKLH